SNNASGTTVANEDWYAITVPSTANPLRLETSTPADGPNEFVNTLNPHLELYDGTGTTLIASGTPLADGRNEFLAVSGLTAGATYKVRVTGEGTTKGEYFLGVNFLPLALDDSATTNEDTPVPINVLANDTDPDGTLDVASVAIVSGPAHGSVSIAPTGV